MAELTRESRRMARLIGRGRDEAVPFYVHLALLVTIAGVAAIVIGIAFAVYYLA